jgi:hypothetical protein
MPNIDFIPAYLNEFIEPLRRHVEFKYSTAAQREALKVSLENPDFARQGVIRNRNEDKFINFLADLKTMPTFLKVNQNLLMLLIQYILQANIHQDDYNFYSELFGRTQTLNEAVASLGNARRNNGAGRGLPGGRGIHGHNGAGPARKSRKNKKTRKLRKSRK